MNIEVNTRVDAHMKSRHQMEFDIEYGDGERRVRGYTNGVDRLLVEIWGNLWTVYSGRLCSDMFTDANGKPITHFESSGFSVLPGQNK